MSFEKKSPVMEDNPFFRINLIELIECQDSTYVFWEFEQSALRRRMQPLSKNSALDGTMAIRLLSHPRCDEGPQTQLKGHPLGLSTSDMATCST